MVVRKNGSERHGGHALVVFGRGMHAGSVGFRILLVVVEDCLPSVLLQLEAVFCFRIESNCDGRMVVVLGLKFDSGVAPAEYVGKFFFGDNLREGRFEVKASAAVPGFHSGYILPARYQVAGSVGAMPAGIGKIPLRDVLWLRVVTPGFFSVGTDLRPDGDFVGLHDAVVVVQR